MHLEQHDRRFELVNEGRERWQFVSGGVPAYSPLEGIVGACGACGGYVFQDILLHSKVKAEVREIEVTYETKPSPAVHALTALTLHFYVQAETPVDYEKAERYVKFVHRYCPVIQSLREDIIITDQVHEYPMTPDNEADNT